MNSLYADRRPIWYDARRTNELPGGQPHVRDFDTAAGPGEHCPGRPRQLDGSARRRRRRGGLHPAGGSAMTDAVVRQLHARSRNRSSVLLVLICLAQFMVVLDISIVNVALPSIRDGLHFSTTGLQWVVSAYTLTFAGFLLLGGRASDLLGRRRVFMAGIALFVLASLACAAGELARAADRRPHRPGLRWRDHLAGQPGDHRHLVRRGSRAQPRAGRLGGRRRHRRRVRGAARRAAHAGPRLAVDLPDQRARRAGRAAARAGDRPRGAADRRRATLRRARCAARHRRSDGDRLRHRAYRHPQLGIDRRARADRPRPAAAGRHSSPSRVASREPR